MNNFDIILISMDNRLQNLDFAALKTLQAVHDHGSFTRAAESLGQTQSNVSYTIARLRRILSDPLFVREGGETRPTIRCTAIVTAVMGLIDDFESVVFEDDFDPQLARATVTLSCNHYERATVLPGLIRRLRTEAPGLRLRSIAAGTDGPEHLKRGTCDLLIGPVISSDEGLYRRRLRSDSYVLAMDRNHVLAEGPIAPTDLQNAPHAAISYAGRWEPLYSEAFRQAGISLDTVVEVAEHGDIGGYVLGTDLVAILPSRLAEGLDPGIRVRPLPVPADFAIDMTWSARTHRAPLFRWLRETISALEPS